MPKKTNHGVMEEVLVKNILFLVFFIPFKWGNAAEKETFQQARFQIQTGDFESGRKGMAEVLQKNPKGTYASRASFMLAKAYLGLGKTEEAQENFKKTISNFPGTEEAQKAAFKLVWISYLLEGKNKSLELARQLMVNGENPYRPELEYLKRYAK